MGWEYYECSNCDVSQLIMASKHRAMPMTYRESVERSALALHISEESARAGEVGASAQCPCAWILGHQMETHQWFHTYQRTPHSRIHRRHQKISWRIFFCFIEFMHQLWNIFYNPMLDQQHNADLQPQPSAFYKKIFLILFVTLLFISILGVLSWYTNKNKTLPQAAFDPAKQFIPQGAASLPVTNVLNAFNLPQPLPFFDERNVVQSLKLGISSTLRHC